MLPVSSTGKVLRAWSATGIAAVLVATLGWVVPSGAAGSEQARPQEDVRFNAMSAATPSATTYLCKGYDACQRAGYPHAGYKAVSAKKTMYWQMYGGHNCTNYAAYRLVRSGMPNKRPWTGEGNATHWGVAMAKITDATPMVGSIAWWRKGTSGGASGHVAYVEQVVSPTEIIVSEDSWGGDFSWRRITSGRGWPDGFIHFNDHAVSNVAAPQVLGTPTVGVPLRADPGVWQPAGTFRYRWFVDGVRLPHQNKATFTPRPAHLGKQVTVRIVGQQTGYQAATADSPTTPTVQPGTLTVEQQPRLSGTAEVDRTLTVDPGVATSHFPASTPRPAIQWYADGAPIPGATGTELTLGQAEIGTHVTAEVTWSAKAYRTAVTASAPTEPVLAGTITASGFGVTGEARRGQVLRVEPGVVEPATAEVHIEWLRNGRPTGVTGETYALGPADVGRRVRPRITITQQHFRTHRAVLPRTDRVVTDPRIRVRTIGRPGRAVVRVRVVAPGVANVRGPVTVRVGRHTVEAPLRKGFARVVVRDLKPGTRAVRVAYAGRPLITPVRARATVEVARLAR